MGGEREAQPTVDPRTMACRTRPSGTLDAVALAEAGHAAGPDLLLRQRLPRRQLPLLAPRARTTALARQQCERGREASVERALGGAHARVGRGVGGEVNGAQKAKTGIIHHVRWDLNDTCP